MDTGCVEPSWLVHFVALLFISMTIVLRSCSRHAGCIPMGFDEPYNAR
jgi:hypothetical protein